MKWLFFLLIVFSFRSDGQVKVYNIQSGVIAWPVKAFRSGINMLVVHGINFHDDVAVAMIDTNGTISNNFILGSVAEMEEPLMARQQINGDIIVTGLNFWDSLSNANIGNYKGFAMVIDSFGSLKHSFRVKDSTTYLNKVLNVIQRGQFYYFTGMNVDSNEINPPISRVFVCKTDILGNLIWFKTYPQFDLLPSTQNLGFELSFDSNHILLGTSIVDSVVGPNYYYSYFMMSIDTNGNFENRIDVPSLACCKGEPGTKTISQIHKFHGNKYIISCSRYFITMDAAFNVIDSFDITQYYYNADFTNDALYDGGVVVGGFKAFGKMYKNQEVFGRDFTSFPLIVKVCDVVPTYDGGLFAINQHLGYGSYVKMDCEGNYINPKPSCWPVSTIDIAQGSIDLNYANETIYIANSGEANAAITLFDLSGKKVLGRSSPPGFNYINISELGNGIYLLHASDGKGTGKTWKILK